MVDFPILTPTLSTWCKFTAHHVCGLGGLATERGERGGEAVIQSGGVLWDTGVVELIRECGVGTHQKLLLCLSRTTLLRILLE